VDIAELDRVRFAYLKRLHEATDGSPRAGVDMWAIGHEFGLDRRGTARVFDYLKDAGLARPVAGGGTIGITHDGVQAVEDALRDPQTAREHFPMINIIAVGNMINSQIQQATDGTTQTIGESETPVTDIQQKDEQRLAFLHRLYELVEAVTSSMISESEVAAALGFDADTTDRVVDYLADQYLVERRAFGGMIGITPAGVDEVEEALRAPRQGTAHFPFHVINNVLSAERIERSQIQIGTRDSTQTMTTDLAEVRALVSQLRAAIAELEFVDDAIASDVAEDVAAAERQLERQEPRRGVARELLASVRHTLEGAAGGALAEHADKLEEVYDLLDRAIGALS
jgi:hypothetical protein